MATATQFKGVLLKRSNGGSPDVFETVGHLTSFDGPSLSVPVIDATHSESSFAEKLVGIPDGGQVTVGVNFLTDDNIQAAVRQDLENRTLRAFQIVLADSAATEIQFSAYVTGFSVSGALNDKISAQVTLTITGKPSFGA